MRILLDTNIFIYREDDRVLLSNLQDLLHTLNKIKAEILIHPVSVEELKKDIADLQVQLQLKVLDLEMKAYLMML